MRNLFEGWHIVVIIIAFLVLFGYKKLPDAARSVGRSMRILKAETKGLRGDDDATPSDTTTRSTPDSAGSAAKQPSPDQEAV